MLLASLFTMSEDGEARQARVEEAVTSCPSLPGPRRGFLSQRQAPPPSAPGQPTLRTCPHEDPSPGPLHHRRVETVGTVPPIGSLSRHSFPTHTKQEHPVTSRRHTPRPTPGLAARGQGCAHLRG